MVISDQTGAVFPVADTKSLGRMLSQFASNKEQMGWMGKRSKEQAQKYSLRVAVDRTVQAIEMVAK
jgi:hypothetical protein